MNEQKQPASVGRLSSDGLGVTEDQVSALLLKVAHSAQGIYPMSTLQDGLQRERTPWEDGWNAAHMSLTRSWVAICKWVRALPPEQRDALVRLLVRDAIEINCEDGETPRPWLLMNDTFGYACADGTDVDPVELPAVAEVFARFGHDGLVAWAARKEQCDVIQPLRTADFEAARAWLCTPNDRANATHGAAQEHP